ncbi:MAG: lysylphosphatidylglycerol synthase transmembrane domain-containing protein [Bryobacteraceae bacterium]
MRIAALLLVVAAVVALALTAGSWPAFDWRLFLRTLRNLDYRWLAASGLFALATYVGRALRWAVLLKPVQPHPSFRNLLSATAIGFTAIVILGRPGEFVRPYLIAVKEKVSFSSQMAAWMLERIYDLLAALLIFGFALAQVRDSGMVVGPRIAWAIQVGGWAVGVTSVICLGVLTVLALHSDRMEKRLLESMTFLPESIYPKAADVVRAFIEGARSTRSWSAVALLTGYTLLEWGLIAACYASIVQAFHGTLHFSLLDILIFMGFSSFGAVVQIPGVGGGVQIVAIVVLTELFRIPLETATSVALVVWFTTFVVIVPIGVGLALREGWNWGQLRRVREEVSL